MSSGGSGADPTVTDADEAATDPGGADAQTAAPTAPTAPAGTSRTERIEKRIRNDKWKNIPLRIEMSECINCDTCLRHCPPQFGAIFNHGIDVIIIPELCSGCGKCLPPVCPVDCIYEDPDWTPAPNDWWQEPLTADVY